MCIETGNYTFSCELRERKKINGDSCVLFNSITFIEKVPSWNEKVNWKRKEKWTHQNYQCVFKFQICIIFFYRSGCYSRATRRTPFRNPVGIFKMCHACKFFFLSHFWWCVLICNIVQHSKRGVKGFTGKKIYKVEVPLPQFNNSDKMFS